jgi:hypothetical protein
MMQEKHFLHAEEKGYHFFYHLLIAVEPAELEMP